jgi:hypothetical protein
MKLSFLADDLQRYRSPLSKHGEDYPFSFPIP